MRIRPTPASVSKNFIQLFEVEPQGLPAQEAPKAPRMPKTPPQTNDFVPSNYDLAADPADCEIEELFVAALAGYSFLRTDVPRARGRVVRGPAEGAEEGCWCVMIGLLVDGLPVVTVWVVRTHAWKYSASLFFVRSE